MGLKLTSALKLLVQIMLVFELGCLGCNGLELDSDHFFGSGVLSLVDFTKSTVADLLIHFIDLANF